MFDPVQITQICHGKFSINHPFSITNLGNLDHDPVQNSMGLANPLWPTRKGTKLQKITQIRLAGEVVLSLCCLAAEGYLSTRKVEDYS